MLLFRSEEHLGRWLEERGIQRGATLTVDQCRQLAATWYRDRMQRGWRRPNPEEAEKAFASIGLTGAFWRLLP